MLRGEAFYRLVLMVCRFSSERVSCTIVDTEWGMSLLWYFCKARETMVFVKKWASFGQS